VLNKRIKEITPRILILAYIHSTVPKMGQFLFYGEGTVKAIEYLRIGAFKSDNVKVNRIKRIIEK
jgi:hypothetical protein